MHRARFPGAPRAPRELAARTHGARARHVHVQVRRVLGVGHRQRIVAVDPETGQGEAHVAFAFATHRAVVDVDTELGLVKVVEIATAQDVGKAINPQAVEGQLEGGIAQGLGLAVMEEIQVVDGKVRKGMLGASVHGSASASVDERMGVTLTDIKLESGNPLVAALYQDDLSLLGRSIDDRIIEPLRATLILTIATSMATIGWK